MFKHARLTLIAVLLLAVLFQGAAAAFSISDVEELAAELAETDCGSIELYKRYADYKQLRVEVISYTVVRGDTLLGIAETFGVSLATISESNGIANPNLIWPGQELCFPVVTGLLYTVASNDSLSALAEKYEVEYEDIWFANSLLSEQLVPGSQLVLPGARLPNPLQRAASLSRSGSRRNYGLVWPLLGKLTSTYGMRRGAFHRGIDIAGKVGKPIYAADAGVVTQAGWAGTYGYMVQVQHQSGLSTLYAHASRLNVVPGDRVSQGDVIAYIGSTGRSTGPHLHFEVRVNGSNVDPLLYLP